MPHRICIASQKGGSGKTTVALNLAVAFAERGRRTLLVDLDPQGGVALSLAQSDTELAGLSEMMLGDTAPEELVVQTTLPNLTFLPRGRLDPADAVGFERALEESSRLGESLRSVEIDRDYVVFDTPSGLGPATRAALEISDSVLVPFQTELLSLRSLAQILHLVDHVRSTSNAALELIGILPTMVEKSKEVPLGVLAELWTGVPGVLDTVIPRHDAYAEASRLGVPVGFLPGQGVEGRRFAMLSGEVEQILLARSVDQKPEDDHEPRRLL